MLVTVGFMDDSLSTLGVPQTSPLQLLERATVSAVPARRVCAHRGGDRQASAEMPLSLAAPSVKVLGVAGMEPTACCQHSP